jgi:uncharacterized glyoxalase superfamily metalloenzyme YdcJ
MGLISCIATALAGPDRTVLTEITAGFATRVADEEARDGVALTPRQRSSHDRLLDAVNRLPRPLMAMGTLLLLVAAMIAPVWFADRMEALAAMPEALWWLIGAVISLYFGARFQALEQGHQRDLVETMIRTPDPARSATPITPWVAETGVDAALALKAAMPAENQALIDWQNGALTQA